jgi:hypothetical protein
MKVARSSLVHIFTLAVCLAAWQGRAATKPWVILTNCRMAVKYGFGFLRMF